MAEDIKISNRGNILVQRKTGVEEHLSETHALSALVTWIKLTVKE